MKKIGVFAALLLTIAASCGKKYLDPVTGYNSRLELDALHFVNVNYVDSIEATVQFSFLVNKDSASIPDTVRFTHKFRVESLTSNERVDFNTPEHTVRSSFRMIFQLFGGGADSVRIGNFSYRQNGNNLLSRPVTFTGGPGMFVSPEIVHDF
jgi:hypothetical protein